MKYPSHILPNLERARQRLSISNPKLPLISILFFLVVPTSNNYQMQNFSFGGGGESNATSDTYALNARLGDTSSGDQLDGATYDLGAGMQFAQQANTPAAPTFENPDNSYNKLKFTLIPGSDPSDTKYAIAISDDDFVTTEYVQAADNTIGPSLTLADYQTYADWGGAAGDWIIGLNTSTSYKIKVKAYHGKFTESEYSQTASASTVGTTLTYDIDVSSTDTETAAPYLLDLGNLAAASVTTSTDKIWVDIDTNGAGGGFVYLYGSNNGLYSTAANYTISSVTGDLSVLTEGVGLQSSSVAQTSGGPLAAQSPYAGAGNSVGYIPTTAVTIFTSSSEPITGGRGAFVIKAKASAQTPAAGDYQDTISVVASASF